MRQLYKIFDGLCGAAIIFFLILLNPLTRKWHLKWGCTPKEAKMPLPGDELVPEIKLEATHAITINKPAAEVWPWIVQIGADRGGFYSYDFLENLVGCKLSSTEHIVPEWQNLKQGDSISLHPTAPSLPVVILRPNESMVLGEARGFHLQPINETNTRFIVRARGGYNPRLKNSLLNYVVRHILYEPIHFVMERKMMLNVKKLAENTKV